MPEKHRYPLNIAGVSITLATDNPLQVTDRFRPFVSDTADEGYVAEFREVHALPQPEGEPVWKSNSYEVFPDGDGGFCRWYFDGLHDNIRFARVQTDWLHKHVLVEYITEERELVSEMGNCFSFSGWEMLLLRERRLILHASCVDTPVGGLLFSGPSGIGKSTQADLWCQYAGAKLMNGDRPILYKSQDGWRGYGSPYAGSSRYFVNDSCRIRAIVMLRQARQCSLRQLDKAEAFRCVFAGITANSWDKSCMALVCELIEVLISDIPVYELCCTPDKTAVQMLMAAMQKGMDE